MNPHTQTHPSRFIPAIASVLVTVALIAPIGLRGDSETVTVSRTNLTPTVKFYSNTAGETHSLTVNVASGYRFVAGPLLSSNPESLWSATGSNTFSMLSLGDLDEGSGKAEVVATVIGTIRPTGPGSGPPPEFDFTVSMQTRYFTMNFEEPFETRTFCLPGEKEIPVSVVLVNALGEPSDAEVSFTFEDNSASMDADSQSYSAGIASATFTVSEAAQGGQTFTITANASNVDITDNETATGSKESKEELSVIELQISAYRPLQAEGSYAPHLKTVVPEEELVTPGVGIRINQQSEAPKNLIEFDLSVIGDAPDDARFVLRRGSADLAVFTLNDRSGELDFNLDSPTTVFEFQSEPPETVWVEWRGEDQGTSSLAFEVHPEGSSLNEGEKLGEALEANFRTFQSVVIVLGGNTQEPPNGGIFTIGTQLYQAGYDAQMFNEDTVAINGTGEPLTEIQNARAERGVSDVAIIGYSWGGGSTHNLAAAFNQAINFTAYIDAILQPIANPAAETRRPPGSAFHVNFFQRITTFLRGNQTIGGDININVNDTDWGANLNHFDIDDHPNVTNGILTNLTGSLPIP